MDNGYDIAKQIGIGIQRQVHGGWFRRQETVRVEKTDESLTLGFHSIQHLLDFRHGDNETQFGIPVELPVRLENAFPFMPIPEIGRARVHAARVIRVFPVDQARRFVRQWIETGVYQFGEQPFADDGWGPSRLILRNRHPLQAA